MLNTVRHHEGTPAASDSSPPIYDLTVVVACYQEESHLRESVRQLRTTLDGLGRSYELIFLDDKSTDRTADLVRGIVADQPHMRAVYHEQNVGRGGTVREGFGMAQGRIVGFLDIDLEVHCRYLPKVLAAIDAGADGATAFREYTVERRLPSIVRHLLSSGYRKLFRMLFRMPFRDPETGFKFFVRDKILPIAEQTRDDHWFWDSEIMLLAHAAGLRLVEVPARFERRADKASTVRVVRDVWRYLVAIRKFRRRMAAAERGEQPPSHSG